MLRFVRAAQSIPAHCERTPESSAAAASRYWQTAPLWSLSPRSRTPRRHLQSLREGRRRTGPAVESINVVLPGGAVSGEASAKIDVSQIDELRQRMGTIDVDDLRAHEAFSPADQPGDLGAPADEQRVGLRHRLRAAMRRKSPDRTPAGGGLLLVLLGLQDVRLGDRDRRPIRLRGGAQTPVRSSIAGRDQQHLARRGCVDRRPRLVVGLQGVALAPRRSCKTPLS